MDSINNFKRCPYCGEQILAVAIKCRFCNSSLTDYSLQNQNINLTTNFKILISKKFDILDVIGQGGMAIVYKARHKVLNKVIALKVLDIKYSRDDIIRERFIREAQLAATLNHEGIVKVFDIDTIESITYIAMEFINGFDLNTIIKRGIYIDVESFIKIFYQIASALDYAHKKGIIHRDIKSNNILIEYDSSNHIKRAVLTDFGIAKVKDFTEFRDIMGNLTQKDEIFGTPGFMSPEQAEGKTVDYRSDIFSLGVVMYHALTGMLPFYGDNLVSILYKLAECKYEPIDKFRKDLPPWIIGLVDKCLQKDINDRFQSCEEIVDLFDGYNIEKTRKEKFPNQTKHSDKLGNDVQELKTKNDIENSDVNSDTLYVNKKVNNLPSDVDKYQLKNDDLEKKIEKSDLDNLDLNYLRTLQSLRTSQRYTSHQDILNSQKNRNVISLNDGKKQEQNEKNTQDILRTEEDKDKESISKLHSDTRLDSDKISGKKTENSSFEEIKIHDASPLKEIDISNKILEKGGAETQDSISSEITISDNLPRSSFSQEEILSLHKKKKSVKRNIYLYLVSIFSILLIISLIVLLPSISEKTYLDKKKSEEIVKTEQYGGQHQSEESSQILMGSQSFRPDWSSPNQQNEIVIQNQQSQFEIRNNQTRFDVKNQQSEFEIRNDQSQPNEQNQQSQFPNEGVSSNNRELIESYINSGRYSDAYNLLTRENNLSRYPDLTKRLADYYRSEGDNDRKKGYIRRAIENYERANRLNRDINLELIISKLKNQTDNKQ